jgi:hypothetical protein
LLPNCTPFPKFPLTSRRISCSVQATTHQLLHPTTGTTTSRCSSPSASSSPSPYSTCAVALSCCYLKIRQRVALHRREALLHAARSRGQRTEASAALVLSAIPAFAYKQRTEASADIVFLVPGPRGGARGLADGVLLPDCLVHRQPDGGRAPGRPWDGMVGPRPCASREQIPARGAACACPTPNKREAESRSIEREGILPERSSPAVEVAGDEEDGFVFFAPPPLLSLTGFVPDPWSLGSNPGPSLAKKNPKPMDLKSSRLNRTKKKIRIRIFSWAWNITWIGLQSSLNLAWLGRNERGLTGYIAGWTSGKSSSVTSRLLMCAMETQVISRTIGKSQVRLSMRTSSIFLGSVKNCPTSTVLTSSGPSCVIV